jgi:hypothetical protein
LFFAFGGFIMFVTFQLANMYKTRISAILLLTPAFDIEAGLLAIVPATSDEKTEQERSDVRKEEVDEKKQE